MKYYCMCQITGDVPKRAHDSQGFGPQDNQVFLAPNRFLPVDKDDEYRPVALQTPMVCIKNGVTQRILTKQTPNMWIKTKAEANKDMDALLNSREYHRGVDMYQCPICRAIIMVE